MEYEILVNKENKVSQDFIDTLVLETLTNDYSAKPLILEKTTLEMFQHIEKVCF